jgi:acetyl-CoA carboxylase biotin carboxyl carrier protein
MNFVSAICTRNQSPEPFVDLRKVRTLVDLVAELNIAELEVIEGGRKVRILKSAAATEVRLPAMQAQLSPSPSETALLPPAAVAPSACQEADERVFKSPMVGVFHRFPKAGSLPNVEVGSAVKKGDKVCMIKAMRLENAIEIDAAGVIKKILVEDGEPVEFGQPLFVVG